MSKVCESMSHRTHETTKCFSPATDDLQRTVYGCVLQLEQFSDSELFHLVGTNDLKAEGSD